MTGTGFCLQYKAFAIAIRETLRRSVSVPFNVTGEKEWAVLHVEGRPMYVPEPYYLVAVPQLGQKLGTVSPKA